MIEKVARAIATVRYGAEGFREEDDGVHYWELCENDARAALEALLEPTEAMVRAGQEALSGHPRPDAIRACIVAAIDAALNEKPPAAFTTGGSQGKE